MKITTSGAIALLMLIPACGVPIRAGSHFAEHAGPPAAATYEWVRVPDRGTGDPRLQNNPFFEERLQEAIDWQLSMRGLRRTDTDPDLHIHHHLSLADHAMIEETIDSWGYNRTEVFEYEEGTILVHLTDARTGQDVWVAWAQANIEPAFAGPDQMRSWVYDLVVRMFRGWPVAAGRPG